MSITEAQQRQRMQAEWNKRKLILICILFVACVKTEKKERK